MAATLVAARFPAPPEPSRVATDWRRRGYSCDLFVDPPGREWRDFVHDCNELVTVVEGRLEIAVAATRFLAGPGDEVFIPAGAVHSVVNVAAGTTRWLYGYD